MKTKLKKGIVIVEVLAVLGFLVASGSIATSLIEESKKEKTEQGLTFQK